MKELTPATAMKKFEDLITSFEHAFAGVWYVIRTQRNARIHVAMIAVVLVAGLWLGLSRLEWALLVVTIGLVLTAEWFNTVAETIVDLVTSDYHPLAKVSKDVAAGAVLLAALVAAIVGFLLLVVPIYERLSRLP